jgi:hypothetical protein
VDAGAGGEGASVIYEALPRCIAEASAPGVVEPLNVRKKRSAAASAREREAVE